MNEVVHRPSVAVYSKENFLWVKTLSGYRRRSPDPEVPTRCLSNEASAADVGKAVLEALSKSRLINREEIPSFFHPDRVKGDYEAWIEGLIKQLGYPSKRSVLKGMKLCHVELENGEVHFMPNRQVKLEAWEGLGADHDVVIPGDATAEQVGVALMQALERCQ
jgi:hypothetical protein